MKIYRLNFGNGQVHFPDTLKACQAMQKNYPYSFIQKQDEETGEWFKYISPKEQKQIEAETYQALSAKIKSAANNKEQLERLEQQATRHYNNNTINARQLSQLDSMIMLRLAKLS